MTDQILYYESMYNLQECMMGMLREPQRYCCECGTDLWYKAEKISDTQVWVTFTGGQFRKMMRTQYLMEFLAREDHTAIVMCFQKELFGLPPMTPLSDIDRCMAQKIKAKRKLNPSAAGSL